MAFSNINDNFQDLGENVKAYLGIRMEILKCVLTEALARMASSLMKLFVFGLLAFFIVFFLSFAFVFWYEQYVGSMYIGALLVAGLYVILGFIAYWLRAKVFLDPLIRKFSRIIFEDEKD